jgi:hypothetical protein
MFFPHLVTRYLEEEGKELTDYMQQSHSWEANSHLASQEIPQLLWNPKVLYHVCHNLPPVPFMNQMN